MPAVVPVKTAVYVPFLVSVTELNVPPPLPAPKLNPTFRPPAVSCLPDVSMAVSVTVAFASATMLDEVVAIVERDGSAVVAVRA